MKLIRLRLRNFRQHADSDIGFSSGMTAIVGANGTGKSTILEAIGFALYGEQRETRETIRFYWAESRNFGVTLHFELDGREFVVERKTGEASLREVAPEKKIWATGLRPVSESCERLLNLSYEQFRNSFCAEQKGLAFLQFANKRARHDEVARMLGFHRLKAAEDLAASRRQALAAKVAALEALVGDPKEAESTRTDAELLHKATLQELQAAQELRDEVEAQLEKSADEFLLAERWIELTIQLREIGGKADGLKETVRLTKEELDSALSEARTLAELEPYEREYVTIEKRIQELQKHKELEQLRILEAAEATRLEKEAVEIRNRMHSSKPKASSYQHDRLEILIGEVERLTMELETATRNWQHDKLSAQARVSEAKAHFSLSQTSLRRAENAFEQGVCAECGQPTGSGYQQVVDQRRRELFETQALLDRATRAAQNASAQPNTVLDAKARLDQAIAIAEVAKHEREEYQRAFLDRQLKEQADEKATRAADIRKRQADLPFLYEEEEHRALEARLKELQPIYRKALGLRGCGERVAKRQASYAEAKANLDGARTAYRAIEHARNELGVEGSEAANAAVARHHTLLQQRSGVVADVAGKEAKLQLASKALDAAVAKVAEVEERARDLVEIRSAHNMHDVLVKEMRRLRLSLNASIGPELSLRASENLSLLTNGRYDTLLLDSDFSARVVEDGIEKVVISGGEEDVVALALRLALSELIQERQGRPMSLLILDEVFASLDTERRQSVLDRLTSLKGRFHQIIVISHIEEINQIADQCLYLVRDAATRATRVTDAAPHGLGSLF